MLKKVKQQVETENMGQFIIQVETTDHYTTEQIRLMSSAVNQPLGLLVAWLEAVFNRVKRSGGMTNRAARMTKEVLDEVRTRLGNSPEVQVCTWIWLSESLKTTKWLVEDEEHGLVMMSEFGVLKCMCAPDFIRFTPLTLETYGTYLNVPYVPREAVAELRLLYWKTLVKAANKFDQGEAAWLLAYVRGQIWKEVEANSSDPSGDQICFESQCAKLGLDPTGSRHDEHSPPTAEQTYEDESD